MLAICITSSYPIGFETSNMLKYGMTSAIHWLLRTFYTHTNYIISGTCEIATQFQRRRVLTQNAIKSAEIQTDLQDVGDNNNPRHLLFLPFLA